MTRCERPLEQSSAATCQCQSGSSRHFAHIFERLADGFFSLDEHWRFTYLNAAARQALLVGDDVLGRSIWDVYPEARETVFEEEFRHAMSTGSTTEFEAFYPRNLIWLRINAFPHENGLAVCFADITQTRSARQKLIELNRKLRQRSRAYEEARVFASTLAHDLLQPLGAILGFSEALSACAVDELGRDSAQYLGNIQSAAKHMNDISQAILRLCGIGRTQMKWSCVDVGELAQECIQVLHAAHPRGQVSCTIMRNMWARCDSGLLRVALQNLLSNAWKFSSNERQPQIEVGAEFGPDDQVVYFVRDNGIGFDPSEAANVFLPFRRLHENAFEGEGIGLATVKSIIDRHGGRIWAESTPGKGTTFYFTLPTDASRS